MIDLSKYRIIDISAEVVPGERKLDGRYLHGEPKGGRPVEVQEFIGFGARMHFIQGQTHTGTHVEATYKYDEAGPDVGSMPLESYMGEAVACDFTHKGAGAAIEIDDLKEAGVSAEKIVLAWGSGAAGDDPYFTNEAIDWMIDIKIKAFGIENLHYAPPGTPSGQGDSDCRLLLAGIPMIDAPKGLDQIKKPRVFFIGLLVRIRRVTASWTRAIVLEEIDG